MKPKNVWTILIILPLLMAACLPQEVKDLTATVLVSPTVEETDPNAISTSVAQTVEAELTQVALSNPTNTPLPSATDVPEPTETPTQPPETPTNTPLPSPTIEAAFDNQAQFVADVTIPDGTPIVAGHTFTKTWRLRNVGTTTWTTDYSFVFINGDRMEGQAVNLSFDVSPGGEIDISIPMIAPDDAGTYVGYWMFKAPDTDEEEGAVFGLGTDARQAIYVEIEVIPATPTPTPTSTPADEEETPTETPTP
ncbi:MAG: NBR1-Ig-like domain-containing protein, partial [Anaerolineales bacterium]